jgi:uncharacterized cupredoxin-like copper-binding protein
MRIHHPILGCLAAVMVVGGCGGGSSHSSMPSSSMPSSSMPSSMPAGGAASRTVDIEMRDVAYSLPSVTVQAGETVKFVFHNAGQALHDAFLGDEAAQAEHEKEMRSAGSGSGGMGMGGDGIKVEPGKTGELTHTFQKGDSMVIGCHEPGHYAAGMKLPVTVS